MSLLLPACKERSPEPTVSEEAVEQLAPAAVADAAPRAPSAALAADALEALAKAVESKDEEAIRQAMRLPSELNERQIDYYLAELVRGHHAEPTQLRLAKRLPFGTLEERFGKHALDVADDAMLSADEAYAVGDAKAGVIFHWDGTRLSVAAVHALAELSEEAPPAMDAGPG